jgi:hypothetical protein
MAAYGWSYLVVTRSEAPARAVAGSELSAATAPVVPASRFQASDGSTFEDEQEMLRELGVTGWELVAIRQAGSNVLFYFKRPRS